MKNVRCDNQKRLIFIVFVLDLIVNDIFFHIELMCIGTFNCAVNFNRNCQLFSYEANCICILFSLSVNDSFRLQINLQMISLDYKLFVDN